MWQTVFLCRFLKSQKINNRVNNCVFLSELQILKSTLDSWPTSRSKECLKMKTSKSRLQNLKFRAQLFTRLFIFWLFKKRHKNTVCHIIKNEVLLFCHFGSQERWYYRWFMVFRTRDQGTTDRLVKANQLFDPLIPARCLGFNHHVKSWRNVCWNDTMCREQIWI